MNIKTITVPTKNVAGAYITPVFNGDVFNCPHCGVCSKQSWGNTQRHADNGGTGSLKDLRTSSCGNCHEPSIWHSGTMVFPLPKVGEAPNNDLPDEIKKDYVEAQQIATLSPRGAAALLRLCVQKLCDHIGEPGKKIDANIKLLVSIGLPKGVQKALDSVRVIGNEAVHPGNMDLRDNIEVVAVLFKLVNIICEKTISEHREINDIYDLLPENKKQGIIDRDG